jgi:hypothetical protein
MPTLVCEDARERDFEDVLDEPAAAAAGFFCPGESYGSASRGAAAGPHRDPHSSDAARGGWIRVSPVWAAPLGFAAAGARVSVRARAYP